VPAASAVEEQGTGGHHSRERGTSERQTSFETVWLKRASTLESRLAPPPAFEAPLASASAVLTAAARTVEQAATPFEMPAPAENLSRLVQSIKVQAKDGLSEANVRLNPEHLGEVTIAVRVDAGTVSAVVRAESADVRQWLRGQEDGIRAALADQGLTLDELVVEQDGQRGREQEQPSDEEQRKARVRARRVSTASFEVSA
jgi:flagellar hook-length control protein FliK